MHLYQKLFGVFMKPAGDEGSAGGGSMDDDKAAAARGDFLSDLDGDGDDAGKKADGDDAGKKADADDGDDPEKKAAGDGEGDGDGDGDGDGEDGQERDSKGRFAKKDKEERIPKSRFDDAVGKERQAREAAERRAAELEAKLKKEEQSAEQDAIEKKIDELESSYSTLLLDGKKEEADKVMKEIRKLNRDLASAESDKRMSVAQEQAVEKVRWDAAVAKLEAAYPVLNVDSEQFDQDIVDIVLGERNRLITVENLAPSAALLKAADKIMAKLQPASSDGERGGKGLNAGKTGSDRKAAQVEKNLDTAKRQPASMSESGKDSDKAGEKKIDVSKLTPAEFDALPESTRAKLRGDFL